MREWKNKIKFIIHTFAGFAQNLNLNCIDHYLYRRWKKNKKKNCFNEENKNKNRQ